MKHIKLLVIFLGALFSLSCVQTSQDINQVEFVGWQSGMDIEQFWQKYTKSKGGLTWGQSKIYPDFTKVKEGDTFMVEVEQGICLMEFFHNRWRRANDVRRWEDSINTYGGCPFVFD